MGIALVMAALGLGILIFAGSAYNRIVALKQRCSQAFADIDVQLRLRYDLIPNLVETVKGYAGHEKSIFEAVSVARSQAMNSSNIGDRALAEGQLGMAVTKLMAVSENYPELKANQNFMSLQKELTDIENKIAAARRFLNNSTSEYNTVIEQFPGVLFARSFGFSPAQYFEISEQEKAQVSTPVAVKF
ncbi:MAG: LemA family protein [Candidatus Cloacimonetes bacterium]|nr:LemA family protein [Candidatus Cloacimonadota bacterium]